MLPGQSRRPSLTLWRDVLYYDSSGGMKDKCKWKNLQSPVSRDQGCQGKEAEGTVDGKESNGCQNGQCIAGSPLSGRWVQVGAREQRVSNKKYGGVTPEEANVWV